jgi:hypothetical protein
MTGLVIGGVVLVLGFVGLCALFAWLVNDWMMHDEEAPGDLAAMGWTEDQGGSQADDP